MRGIDAIISVILLLMITVALVATSYAWFSGMFGTVTAGGTNVTERAVTITQSGMQIESAYQNKIYVRNTGNVPLTGLSVFLNDNFVNSTVTEPVAPGSFVELKLKNYINAANCRGNSVRISTIEGATATYRYDNILYFCEDWSQRSGTDFGPGWIIAGGNPTIDSIPSPTPNSLRFQHALPTRVWYYLIRNFPLNAESNVTFSSQIKTSGVYNYGGDYKASVRLSFIDGSGATFNYNCSGHTPIYSYTDCCDKAYSPSYSIGLDGTQDWTLSTRAPVRVPCGAVGGRLFVGILWSNGTAWFDNIKTAIED